MTMNKLCRSRTNKMLAGICGGIGEAHEIDPTLLRLILVFLALATGLVPLLITYIVGWIIIPEEGK